MLGACMASAAFEDEHVSSIQPEQIATYVYVSLRYCMTNRIGVGELCVYVVSLAPGTCTCQYTTNACSHYLRLAKG